jgi:predicted AlkP superfamily pyrophosphatase or phosphodiesterase
MLPAMRWEVGRRGAAIGVVYGIAAAAETVRITPALRDGPGSVVPALEIVALFVCVFAAIGAATAAALMLLGALGRGVGVPALDRLGSGRALWPIALLGIAFAALNESMRGIPVLEEWRYAIRAALIALAVFAVLRALLRDVRTPAALRAVEATLALLLLPAIAGCVAYALKPLPKAAGDVTTGGVLALAPRFAPEPAEAFERTRDPGRPRVLLIGIDGASWDRIDRGIAAGRLPTFARLKREGITAPLGSLIPTYSPRIWTSMVTGVPASEHGIEDFYLTQLTRLGVENFHLRRSFSPIRRVLDAAGELRFVPVTSSLRRRKAIWNLADEGGLRSAVVGLWATWPPETLQHGEIISDHASLARQQEWLDRGKANGPNAGVTMYPPALQERLAALQRAPDSVTREELASFVEVDDATWLEFEQARQFSKGVPLSAFRSSHLNDDFYAHSARTLWSEDRPDLLVLYLRAVDELSHFFCDAGASNAAELGWSARDIQRFGGVVDHIYEWTDRAIAPLVDEALRDPNVLLAIVSDHGWEREPDGRNNHNFAPPGILILAGAGVCREHCAPLGSPTIYDVAPTVLARLGLPLSRELVGHPLDAAFTVEKPIVEVAAYGGPQNASHAVSSEADAQMREKLEALGYMRK